MEALVVALAVVASLGVAVSLGWAALSLALAGLVAAADRGPGAS